MRKGLLESRLHSLIGPEATGRLIDRFRYGFLYVPSTLDENHVLAETIGLELAQRLSSEFGGNRLPVPTGAARRIAVRNLQIVADRAAGESVTTLACRYQLSLRHIYGILREARLSHST